MRILVTGGLGFIGRVVADRLQQVGHAVTVLSRQQPKQPGPSGLTVVQGDIRDRDRIAEIVVGGGFDGVCHLAGRTQGRESFADPVGYYDTNLGGTINLLRALEQATARSGKPGRLVFASTVMVYGPADGHPIDETHPLRPMSPYGASKLAAEQLLGSQAATGRLGATSLRVFAAAGAVGSHHDTDRARIIPKALAVARGDVPFVQVNGDGSAVREFTHVADVAEAYRLALQATKPGEHAVYNVGTGNGVTVRDLLATVEEVTGRPVPVTTRPGQREPAAVIADTRRIKNDLGWEPGHSTIDQIIRDAWVALESCATDRGLALGPVAHRRSSPSAR
jgi:UDP-glucose 4-epimerase